MQMYRVIFFGALAFFAVVAMFIGMVVVITSLQNGAITWSYTSSGKGITETISRAADAARFWKLLSIMGIGPLALGAAVMWFSVRKLRAP